VTRHVDALARELLAQGHDVQVFSPADGGPLPDFVTPLGGTLGFRANGARSNLTITPAAVMKLRDELGGGGFDVVHIHSPEAPMLSWDALCVTPGPLVGTFHSYNPRPLPNTLGVVFGAWRRFNRLHVRIAVSEAARWQMERWAGGRYRIVPNGVHVPAAVAPKPARDHLHVAFVGQAVERKGLPVLLRAFEALRDVVPARLTVVGAAPQDVAPLLLDAEGVEVLGGVDDEAKARVLADADVLCAPSLGGESFGMVLTEAFAQGTPVVASDIAGYRDVVRDGVDGLLVPRGDAGAVAAALRDLALDPDRRRALGAAARERAGRYAWPHVAEEVVAAYEDAIAIGKPATAAGRAAARLGLVPADGLPPVRAHRMPSPEPPPPAGTPHPAWAVARRAALAVAGAGAAAGAVVALDRIGVDAILASLVASSPAWVLVGLAIMCASLLLRAEAWRAILSAALPGVRVRRSDAVQGTMIGVLMSATLPARLGEPSRALIVARRLGRVRERLPVVVGTLVSQTLLNVLALVILGATMLSTVDFLQDNRALVGVTIAPVAVLLCVLVAPAIVRAGGSRAVTQAVSQVRAGLRVFRQPRLGATAVVMQLGAWGLQWLSCFALLVALGLDDRAGLGAAAAVLFAVNVTAVIPVVPSNLGVFQAACVAVLAGYGVGYADALAYGIVLQAVEIATAVVLGAPALIREGVSWREIRLRAMHTAPVRLPEREPAGAEA